MELKHFKKGDTVKYIHGGGIGWEKEDDVEVDWAFLATNGDSEGHYTIDKFHGKEPMPYVTLLEDDFKYHIHPNHFELAN